MQMSELSELFKQIQLINEVTLKLETYICDSKLIKLLIQYLIMITCE